MGNNILTKEMLEKLYKSIEKHKGSPGALMPVLQDAQKIFGCVSVEVQKRISDGLEIPLAEVYGVATFYSQFTLEPKGENVVGVCLGTACYVKGSQDILDEVSKILGVEPGKTTEDGKFTLVANRCVGACGLAPVMTVNEDVYGKISKDEVKKIMSKY